MPNQLLKPIGRFALIVLLSVPMLVQATSVRQLSLAEVMQTSKLIFSGQVVASESRWNEDRTAINTLVTFRVDETIKGQHSGQNLTLRFLGGMTDGVLQQVAAMRYPQLGENGVYFVTDPNQVFAHPLVGWSQGHYKEVMVNGSARMVTADDRPISAIRTSEVNSKSSSTLRLSNGFPDGVSLNDDLNLAMTKSEFMLKVSSQIEASGSK